MRDEAFYAEVAEELRLSDTRPGLWAKAFSESGGNEAHAKALYIRYRVKQLKSSARAVERSQGGHEVEVGSGGGVIYSILASLILLILVLAFGKVL